MIDPVEFGRTMAGIVREVVAPLQARIDELEARAAGSVAAAVAEYLKANPPPPGRDGKDAEPFELSDVIRELLSAPELATLVSLHVAEGVEKHFEANPVRHGKDGKDGDPGKDAEPVTDDRIAKQVSAYLRENPPEPGKPGRDGLDVKDMLRSHEGHLIAVMSDGTTRDLGLFVGKDGVSMAAPEPGYDPQTNEITLRFGEKELRYPAGGMRYRGYWRDGERAIGGDCWTHDGTTWIALKSTNRKPCLEAKEEWCIAARKGRDGRDLRDSQPPGPVKVSP